MKFKKLGELPPFSIGSVESRIRINVDGSKLFPEFTGSQCPCPLVLKDRVRVYFSARDLNDCSNCFYYDLDRNNLTQIIYRHEKPVIPLGKSGEADQDGVMCSQVNGNGAFIYSGWNRISRDDVKYRTACMYFDSKSNTKYIRYDRTSRSPCGTGMPFDYKDGRDLFMSFRYWKNGEPIYGISSSNDSESGGWYESSELESDNFCYARPVLLTIKRTEYLFYSKRRVIDYRNNPKNSYKIYVKKKYYKSDSAEELVEIEGQDPAKMLCYAYPIRIDNRVIMFYNTDFQSAINVAELID